MAAARSFLAVAVVLAALVCLAAGEKHSIYSKDGSPSWAVFETIPENVDLYTKHSTFDVWLEMFNKAEKVIRIGAFYMDFANGTQYLDWGGQNGVDLLDALIAAGRRGVEIQIALNEQVGAVPYSPDAHLLQKMGLAEVRWIKWSLVSKYGIVHTKLVMADDAVALGSANVAWDSTTQVKELGVVFTNSPIVTEDINKVWEMYWYLGADNVTSVPNPWPAAYNTFFNSKTPLNIDVNDQALDLYLSVDPPQLATPERDVDLTALPELISSANKYVYLEVMDIGPFTVYEPHNYYFPALDSALRAAPFNTRGVELRMLIGVWNHTYCQSYPYLQSLAVLTNVTVKLFKVPDLPIPVQIPFTRVAHSKYVVTDTGAWVSTQNMYADYMISTAGISWNFMGNSGVVEDITDKFLRDWDSEYAHDICLEAHCDWGHCSTRPINS